jgi:hypothetical protein
MKVTLFLYIYILGMLAREALLMNVGETRTTKLRVWGETQELGRATERIVNGNMEVSIQWTLNQFEMPIVVSLPFLQRLEVLASHFGQPASLVQSFCDHQR